jgi:hypothetical protein
MTPLFDQHDRPEDSPQKQVGDGGMIDTDHDHVLSPFPGGTGVHGERRAFFLAGTDFLAVDPDAGVAAVREQR